MTKTELIAIQAKRLEEYKLIIKDYKKRMKNIRNIIYCIAGICDSSWLCSVFDYLHNN